MDFQEWKTLIFRSEGNDGMETQEKYGRLTPIRKKDGGMGRNIWECRCDCGNICYVRMSNLKSGHTKSCGCLRQDLKKSKFQDLTGQRFGKLTVLGLEQQKPGFPSLWKCQCDCGNITYQYGPNLKRGYVVSCGCYQKENGKRLYRQNLHYIGGTQLELVKSKKLWKTNKTGVKGVYQEKKTGKYIASITFQGERQILGRFLYLEDAKAARARAEEERDQKLNQLLSQAKGQAE